MENKVDIEEFIAKKHAEKQSDDIILNELVALGWDKNIVLQKLAGGSAPIPEKSSAETSQTGNTGAPIQVENVQYNVKVGRVTSKIGLVAFLSAIMVWLIAFVSFSLLTAIRAKFLPDCELGICEDVAINFGEVIVFSIAVLAPVIPVFLFLRNRLKKLLDENPANRDDIFFKRSIRFNLVISLLIALWWSYVAIFNVLGKLFLKYQDVTGGMIADSIIIAVIFIATTLFFWQYQKLTRR